LRGLLWSVLLVVVILLGSIAWLLTTTGGARFGIDQVLARLPVDAVVGQVGGRLIGPLRLTDVVVSSDTFQVSVDQLSLEWEPFSLLRKRASVDRLRMSGVRGRLNLEALQSGAEGDTAAAEPDSTAEGSSFEVDVRDLRIDGLEFEMPGVGRVTDAVLSGSGGIGSGGIGDARLELTGNADLRPAGGPSGRIDLTASGWIDAANVEIEAYVEADAELPIPPGHVLLVASGSLDSAHVTLTADTETGTTPLPPMHLELEASGSLDSAEVSLVAETKGGTTRIPPSHIELEAFGGLDGYRLTATVVASGTDELPPIDVTFAGTGDDGSFDVETALANVLEGQVRFAGSVEWDPELRWIADLEVDSLAPASLTPAPDEWPGRISLRGESSGRIVGGRLQAAVRIDTLGGHLRGASMEGRLSAAVADGVIDVEELRLDWGSLDLDASGRIADSIDVEFDLKAPDLGLLLPDMVGSVRTAGSLSGRLGAPRIDATYDVVDLRIGTVSAAAATGSIDLDLASTDGGRVDLSALSLTIASVVLDSLEVHLRGLDEGHELRVAGSGPDGDIDLLLAGILSKEEVAAERTWDGRIASLAIDIAPAGAWVLTEPADLVLSADSVRLSKLCLTAVDRVGRVCAAADWNQPLAEGIGSGTTEVELIGIELARLDTLIAGENRFEGGLSGVLRAEFMDNGDLAGDGTVTLGPGTIETVRDGETTRVRFGGPGLQFSAGPGGVSVTLSLQLEQEDGALRTTVEGEYRVPGLTNLNQDLEALTVEGALRAAIPDLAFVEALLPELKNTKGSATIDLAIAGTFGDPRTTGEVVVTGVETDIPGLGIQLRGVELTGRSEEDGVLVVHGQLTSGAGTITIEGRSPLVPSESNPTTLTIRGDRFTAANTGNMQIEISPDLELRITRDLVVVQGDVLVPAANIEIIEVPESAVRVSRDVVIVGDTIERASPVRTEADIMLTIGDEVFFRGFGLNARLEGALRIQESPGSATRGSGEIQLLNGRYTAFGQNLEINPGRIVFSGPVDNPGLDLTARRTAADGTEAGLRVGGTVRVPDIEVFSTPPKSQSEALSYLLFGRPLNDMSSSDQGQVGNAAAVIGGSMLATSLGQSIGLDEARIETGANPNEASLVAGKYLSPHIYVAYGIGLYDRASIFRIRYIISRRWTIQVETGRYNSTDILYRIERG
jgi:translocation and assembly module TamB